MAQLAQKYITTTQTYLLLHTKRQKFQRTIISLQFQQINAHNSYMIRNNTFIFKSLNSLRFENHRSTFGMYIENNSVSPTAEHSTTLMSVLPIALNLELSTVGIIGRYGKFEYGECCSIVYDSMKSGRTLPTF
jgi:hypothetical protein